VLRLKVLRQSKKAIGNRNSQDEGVKAEGFKESGICSSAVSMSIVNCPLSIVEVNRNG